MKRIAIVTGALSLALVAGLWAQPVTQPTLTGNECWNAGQGPGGPSSFICSNVVRNSKAGVVGTIAGSFTIGSTAAQASLVTGGNLLVTAQPAAATITLPPNPVPDGAIVGVCNVGAAVWAVNVVTLAANTGQTLATSAALTTQAQGTCARVQWNLAAATWYRIQ
jgi:hypothetical protein